MQNRSPPADTDMCPTNSSFCELGDLARRLGFINVAGYFD